jgi:hypothetical protein
MLDLSLARAKHRIWRRVSALIFFGSMAIAFALSPASALGQAITFGGNAQHTSNYAPPAQTLSRVKWTATVDFNNTGALVHYGSPLVTAANTVLAPVKIANDGFQVSAFNGATGASKYSVGTDYILPDHNWIPSYNPCIATGAFGTRLYYAGAGGTIFHIDNPDSNTPGAPVREVFYTSLGGYNSNAAAFNNTVFVNTPITADSSGNIYFGFRVQGTAPAPLNTQQSGFARIDTTGHGTFVLAGTAANDVSIDRDSHNVAPALSNDGSTLYVVVKWSVNQNYGYLLGLDSTTLATKYRVFLRDPRNGNPASIREDGTSSPLVGPDGDVYFGIIGNPNNGSRGFLLHFSGDLTNEKTPGAFGWDYTPGIVPANLVPAYTGPSSYLLFCKYNDYFFDDGTGVNRVALLDPNTTQFDPHSSAPGLIEMREVLTVIGLTPDPENPTAPGAVKEWCINAPAVNPATSSVFFDNEDGHIYRWNLATNSLDQTVVLTAGIGQPYVPTVIGPDGTVFTLNGGTLFALGNIQGVNVTLSSSSPDLRETVVGSPITFTATVSSPLPSPTGSMKFEDLTYIGLTPVVTTLASSIPLDGNGRASITTSSLTAGGAYLGNHFITATYGGDGNHPASFMVLVQKVHANASTTALAVSPSTITQGQPVSFTATVASLPAAAGIPSGMVTFYEDENVFAQVPLDANGTATATKSTFNYGTHAITARYASDTQFAASGGSGTLIVNSVTPPSIQLSASAFAASEGISTLDVQVTRTGDISGSSTVDYLTSDTADPNNCGIVNGAASSRCDYLTNQGTLHFAAGEVSQTIKILLIDDNRAEGSETFTITLSNATTATLGSPSTATLTINDNETVNGTSNPLDQTPFFVRQHYLDFLDREPDQGGLTFWIDEINGNANNTPPPCPNGDTNCVNTRRINVSDAFFFEPEFQQTGAFVYRLYRAAFGNNQPIPNPATSSDFPGENLKMPSYTVFAQDRATVRGGSNLAQEQLALANAFVQRPAFIAKYPLSLSTAGQFVDAVLTNLSSIGVTLTSERGKLITLYGSLGRGGVMYRVADDNLQTNPINNRAFIDAEYNRAFVYTQYGGYLRRDSDIRGFVFWLDQVNSGPLRDTGKLHAMVCSFITSSEYQLRFSSVVSHNNTECPR